MSDTMARRGFEWRAEPPPEEPSTALVADKGTHHLLDEVVQQLLHLRGGHQVLNNLIGELALRGPSEAPTGGSDTSRLESILASLTDVMEDIATRPIPAPNVEVRSPGLPRELTMLPALLRDLLERPAVSEETLEAIRSIRPAVSVQGGVGTIGLQKVIESINTEVKAISAAKGATAQKTEIDYFTEPNTSTKKPRYIGTADQGTARALGAWKVKKINYDVDGDESKIEVLEGVAFDAPDTLAWEV